MILLYGEYLKFRHIMKFTLVVVVVIVIRMGSDHAHCSVKVLENQLEHITTAQKARQINETQLNKTHVTVSLGSFVPELPLFRWVLLFRWIRWFLWVPSCRWVSLFLWFRWGPLGDAVPLVPLVPWFPWLPLVRWVPLFR